MLCGSQHYISPIDMSIKNTGVTRTSKNHSCRKEVQDSKGANTCPFIFLLIDNLKLEVIKYYFEWKIQKMKLNMVNLIRDIFNGKRK